MGIGANQRRLFFNVRRGGPIFSGWSWIALFLLGLGGVSLASIAGLVEPKPLTIIQNAVFRPHRQPPVYFRHGRHEAAKVACTACHHDYQGGRNLWRQGQPVRPCSDCHKMVAEAGKPDLKTAYHRQCKDCHRRRHQERQAGGPIKCRDCHRSL